MKLLSFRLNLENYLSDSGIPGLAGIYVAELAPRARYLGRFEAMVLGHRRIAFGFWFFAVEVMR